MGRGRVLRRGFQWSLGREWRIRGRECLRGCVMENLVY